MLIPTSGSMATNHGSGFIHKISPSNDSYREQKKKDQREKAEKRAATDGC